MMIEAIRAGLAERADPVKAPDMQRYMKSAMPFLGVQKPGRVKLAREVFEPLTRAAWESTVRTLWHEAEFREERYMALAVLKDRRYRDYRDLAALPLYEEFFIRKAIGWALRSYAWTDSAAVVAYCDTDELAPLSRREALKYIRA